MSKKILLVALTIALAAGLLGGSTMAWFTAKAQAPENEFTAGTVMIEADSNMISSQYFDPDKGVFVYGIEGKTGDIYEVDVLNKLENKIFDNPNNYSGWYPNALSFDKTNDRLYFARNRSELWFYDFSEDKLKKAGNFQHSTVPDVGNKDVYGAAFGGGKYWYVPNGTPYLFNVAFNPDGTIDYASYDHAIMTDAPNMNFGDVVIDYVGGMIYGSSTAFYFTYDTVSDEFINYGATGAQDLQLAWGSDGNLYGHRSGTADTRAWYEIVPEDGAVTDLEFQSENSYYDLASGYKSFWNPGDCAWKKFFVRNTGSKDIRVRVAWGGEWEFNWEWLEENWDALCFSGKYEGYSWDEFVAAVEVLDAVEIQLLSDDWEKAGEYYYYTGPPLAQGEEAELSLKVCFVGEDATNEFQGATYKLSASFWAVQSSNDAPYYEWGVELYGTP